MTKASTERNLMNHQEQHRAAMTAALKEIGEACAKDFTTRTTEFGESRCAENEPVADGLSLTFGMIRRAQVLAKGTV